MSLEFNKLGKTQIANSLRIVSKEYSPQEFVSVLTNKYNAENIYEKNELVVFNGQIYISLLNDNINNQPNHQSQYWFLITNENKVLSVWNQDNLYKEKAVVYYENDFYVSLTNNNKGNLPVDTNYWKKYSCTFRWQNNLVYEQGDYVSFGNKLYFSLKGDNFNKRPDENNDCWELYSEYGSQVKTLIVQLDGQNVVEDNYSVSYDYEDYKIVIVHNLNGRVNGIIYDQNDKQAFYGIDYIDENTISIQMNSQSFPNQEKTWKICLYPGTGFSVRYVNYDDTSIREDIIEIENQILMLKRKISNLEGGMLYIGSVDLSEYRNSEASSE